MKIRNGFVSNSSSSSFVGIECNDSQYCPNCFSNKDMSGCDDGGYIYYSCGICHSDFSKPITLKDIRKLKLEKLC